MEGSETAMSNNSDVCGLEETLSDMEGRASGEAGNTAVAWVVRCRSCQKGAVCREKPRARRWRAAGQRARRRR